MATGIKSGAMAPRFFFVQRTIETAVRPTRQNLQCRMHLCRLELRPESAPNRANESKFINAMSFATSELNGIGRVSGSWLACREMPSV